ncbi:MULTISPECIES: ATP-binding protein [Microvirga]|uniref:ATP-binding protein n=1 Tax=Microvirga TaxID=186650 RepID=UPI001B38DBA7|nr:MULTISPECIES: ATP-binding protein [unclassified Microvirga]MBQ0819356.1 hypothetical protein [Microvirga sp. HBU67558]
MIDDTLSLVSHRIRGSRVFVERKPAASSPMVMTSRLQLAQSLVNLLQNALSALEAQPEPLVEIALAEMGEVVAMSDRDVGPSLALNICRNLGIPFAIDKENGLGVRLVISKGITRGLGGSLRRDANHEKGASFTVELRRAG